MKSTFVVAAATIACVSFPRVATAQPGQTPPDALPPPAPSGQAAPPTPAGWGNVPPGEMETGYYLLSDDERQLLREGEIGIERHVAGAALAMFMGYGSGQAVQGRFDDTGWIFLIGDGLSTVGVLIGVAACAGETRCQDGALTILFSSVMALGILRTWSTLDAFIGPVMHNSEVRRVRTKAYGNPAPQWGLQLLPTTSDGNLTGATAGVSLRF